MVIIKFKNVNSKREVEVPKSKVAYGLLVEKVKQKWPLFQIAAFTMLLSDDRELTPEDVFTDYDFPLEICVRTDRKGFADFTQALALKYAEVSEVCQEESSVVQQSIDDNAPALLHTMKDLEMKHALYDPLDEGCEYTRREFISSVLCLAATTAGVKLACEEKIEGSLGNGPVDWVAHYSNYRICITEGKKDNLSHGVVQNIAQLAAASENLGKKRKFDHTMPLYGIATTYTEWVFLSLSLDPNKVSRIGPTLTIGSSHRADDVKKVAEQIVSIFEAQKKLIKELPKTKRTKVAKQ